MEISQWQTPAQQSSTTSSAHEPVLWSFEVLPQTVNECMKFMKEQRGAILQSVYVMPSFCVFGFHSFMSISQHQQSFTYHYPKYLCAYVLSHIFFVEVQILHHHFRLPSADLLCSNMTPKPQLLGVCVQPQLRHRADSWASCTGRQVDLYVLQVRGLSTIRCFLQTTAVFFGDTMDENCKDYA